jgi:hypothetical protein
MTSILRSPYHVSILSDCRSWSPSTERSFWLPPFYHVSLHIFFHWLYSPHGPWPLFSFMIILQTVELLGRVISSSQGLYLNTGQHKYRINTYTKHPCLVWVSNPRSQLPSERRQSCLRPLSYCDWRPSICLPQNILRNKMTNLFSDLYHLLAVFSYQNIRLYRFPWNIPRHIRNSCLPRQRDCSRITNIRLQYIIANNRFLSSHMSWNMMF